MTRGVSSSLLTTGSIWGAGHLDCRRYVVVLAATLGNGDIGPGQNVLLFDFSRLRVLIREMGCLDRT